MPRHTSKLTWHINAENRQKTVGWQMSDETRENSIRENLKPDTIVILQPGMDDNPNLASILNIE